VFRWSNLRPAKRPGGLDQSRAHLPWRATANRSTDACSTHAGQSTDNLETTEGKWSRFGNSRRGIAAWLNESRWSYEKKLRLQFEPLYQTISRAERTRMKYVIPLRRPAGSEWPWALPEWVLRTHALPGRRPGHGQGRRGGGAAASRGTVGHSLQDAAAQAMRTWRSALPWLAAATPPDETGRHSRREVAGNGAGVRRFVAIRDPLREAVKEAIARVAVAPRHRGQVDKRRQSPDGAGIVAIGWFDARAER